MTTDPQRQHQEALADLDRQIELARDVDLTKIGGDGTCWYSVANLADSHHTGGAGLCDEDARYIADLDPAKRVIELEGRKRILLRHAPKRYQVGRLPGMYFCAGCGKPWEDCPDWRDATADLFEVADV